MKEKFFALLKSLNLVPPDKEAQVKAEIDKMEIDTPKNDKHVDISKVADPAIKELVQSIADHNKVLTQQVSDLTSALTAEKRAREDATRIQTDKIAADRILKYDGLIAAAKKDGRIVEGAIDALKKKFPPDSIDALEYHLSQLKPDKHNIPPEKSQASGKGSGIPLAMKEPFLAGNQDILKKVAEYSGEDNKN